MKQRDTKSKKLMTSQPKEKKMIAVLNRQKDGFVQRKPGSMPGRYPFHVGNEAVSPTAGDFVFVEPAHRGNINSLLTNCGLTVGRLMGGHEYLIEEA